MKLDDFIRIETSDLFKTLPQNKKDLLRALKLYWKDQLPKDVYEYCVNPNSDEISEIKQNVKAYNCLRTKLWRHRKIFRDSEKGLFGVELIINSADEDVASVYSALFDEDKLLKYFSIRFPSSNKAKEISKARLIEILKLLKPITRNSIKQIISEIEPEEFETLRDILKDKNSPYYDIVLSTFKGVEL